MQVLGLAVSEKSADRLMKDPLPKLVAFRNRHHLTYPLLSDEDQTVFDQFGGGAIPTCIIIDKDGYLAANITANLDEVRATIEQLITYGPVRQ